MDSISSHVRVLLYNIEAEFVLFFRRLSCSVRASSFYSRVDAEMFMYDGGSFLVRNRRGLARGCSCEDWPVLEVSFRMELT
jgi:hypothetical protein